MNNPSLEQLRQELAREGSINKMQYLALIGAEGQKIEDSGQPES